MGKSGSGKSTLLRILGTLDMPDEGTVKIGDIDIYGGSTRLSDRQLSQFRRRNIGFVYQDYNLFPEYTAYENIIFLVHLDKRLNRWFEYEPKLKESLKLIPVKLLDLQFEWYLLFIIVVVALFVAVSALVTKNELKRMKGQV